MPRLKQSLHSLLKSLGHVFAARDKKELIHLEPPGYAPAKPGNEILVIEEEQDLALLIKLFLARKNYNVQLAHNGADGIAIAAVANPGLIWVSSKLIDRDPHLLQQLRDAAPKARITEKTKTLTLLKPHPEKDGAKIE